MIGELCTSRESRTWIAPQFLCLAEALKTYDGTHAVTGPITSRPDDRWDADDLNKAEHGYVLLGYGFLHKGLVFWFSGEQLPC